MRWTGKKCMAKVSMGDTCRDAACMQSLALGVTVGQTPSVLTLHLSMFCETSTMIFWPGCALTSSCHNSLSRGFCNPSASPSLQDVGGGKENFFRKAACFAFHLH